MNSERDIVLCINQSQTTFPWALLIIIVFFGMIRRKTAKGIADSAIKAVIGYYLVVIGASLTAYSTQGISEMMYSSFQCHGGIMNTETFFANLFVKYGQIAIAIMFLSFAFNVLLARISRLKGVFLTAHHLLYLSLISSMFFSAGTRLPLYAVVLLGSLCTSVFAWLCVATARPVIHRVTGDKDVSMANSNIGAVLIGAGIGKLTKRDNSCSASKEASQIKSIPGIAAVTVFAVYLILFLLIGREGTEAVLGGAWLSGILTRSMLYGAQIALLLYGIRMLLAPVIEIFWEFSQKLVPDIWKGLDASILIGYQPRAWHLGFTACCVGGWIATLALAILRMPYVPIMNPTSAYFTGGVAGVCGYVFGNKPASIIAGAVSGLLMVVFVAFASPGFGTMNEFGVVFGEAQYGLFALIVRLISRLFA